MARREEIDLYDWVVIAISSWVITNCLLTMDFLSLGISLFAWKLYEVNRV